MTCLDKIVRLYDIRGVFGEDLTRDEAELIGKAFGTYIRQRGETTAIVGCDNRKSSPDLKLSLIHGLRATGIDVINIGTVITPIFYYAAIEFGVSAGVMVTASHNPEQYNGFKVLLGGRTLYGPELQEIGRLAKKGAFERGQGGYLYRSATDAYIRMIGEKIALGPRKLRVVADAGNGTAGLFAPEILRNLGCDVTELFCDSNPAFPNHFPDPARPENLNALIRAVRTQHADVGLGFDGDGDRLGVVDANGNIVFCDRLMVLFWREILPKHPRATGIVEIKCSDILADEIERLGGTPFFYNTGHSLIKAKMKETGAVFAGEMSGHFFFADEYFGYDDAVYAAARLLRILSYTRKPLSALLADLPKTFATPEIRIPCAEEEKAFYVERAGDVLRQNADKTIEIDGVRGCFAEGWGLVRASNTGPELIVRCEGKTEEARDRILSMIEEALLPLKMNKANE